LEISEKLTTGRRSLIGKEGRGSGNRKKKMSSSGDLNAGFIMKIQCAYKTRAEKPFSFVVRFEKKRVRLERETPGSVLKAIGGA